MLNFKVKNQSIIRADDFIVVADSKNYLTAAFECSEEWIDDIFVVFCHDDKIYHQKLIEGSCIVPWEVIKPPYFTVSLFCGDLITSNIATVTVERSGMKNGEAPGTPTPSLFNQYLNALISKNEELAESIRFPIMSETEYNNTEFNEDKIVIVFPDNTFEE